MAMVMVGIFFSHRGSKEEETKPYFHGVTLCLQPRMGEERSSSTTWEGFDTQGCDCTWLCFQFLPGAVGF